ncbi:hypothetical protein C0992_001620 [Termitomyces sp. T32_za158]|nr:hypothetical protein C0992_001620 [Termitomyces sp. T32_za158]
MPTRSLIFLQTACRDHRYIRSRDLDAIVERPERLRAVTLGLAAALARLESSSNELDTLTGALDRLSIAVSAPRPHAAPALIVRSTASVDLLHDPAVRFIHGDAYPAQLSRWAQDSREAIASGTSEIPEGLPQGDLYLCPESIGAMQGAVGTVCEAVDSVVTSASDRRAFVAVRPPGHHCGEDSPAGFCFVNNVAVGAAHAHLKHGVNRVVILDIDLHHGNGTQALVWRINEETHRRNLEAAAGAPRNAGESPGLQMYYGSIHDVLSYPCEDGSAQHIAAASLCIHAAHGQHIENVHLQPYTPGDDDGDKHFWDVLYAKEYARILHRAAEFLERTGGQGDDVLVFIRRVPVRSAPRVGR